MAAPARCYEDDDTTLDAKTEEYLQDTWLELFETKDRFDLVIERVLAEEVADLQQPEVLRELCIDMMATMEQCARVVNAIRKAHNRLEKQDAVHDCI